MRWRWGRLPPVMERTLRDDLKWAFLFLSGVTIGFLLGIGDASLLLSFVIGTAVLIIVLNIARAVTHRWKA